MKPIRIQLRRTKGWRMPLNTVKADRTTELGNPYRVVRSNPPTPGKEYAVMDATHMWFFSGKREAAEASVKLFRHWITSPQQRPLRDRGCFAARRKNIACWCALDMLCHGDVWLELANA